MPLITPDDLAAWRRALREEGDGEYLDPITAQVIAPRLMAEVERLWGEVRAARLAALREAAQLVDGRLAALARREAGLQGYGCIHCGDAEAREAASALRQRAAGGRAWDASLLHRAAPGKATGAPE
jgi:hypothetical protein